MREKIISVEEEKRECIGEKKGEKGGGERRSGEVQSGVDKTEYGK